MQNKKYVVINTIRKDVKNMEEFQGIVEVFPDGWFYIDVPKEKSDPYLHLVKHGNVVITAYVGETGWDTLLWGYGDEKFFITLSAKIRKAEHIDKGKTISVRFEPRT